NIKENLDIRLVRWIDEVLQIALTQIPVKMVTDDDELPDIDETTDLEVNSKNTITEGLSTH
ncbi:hypothetical protein TI05_15695, partial [Achromatium sp. WMS3]